MALTYARTRFGAIAVGLTLALAACTVHKTETPPLTGPSSLGTTIVITVSPDVLSWDGASQSLVTITAIDSNGQPLRNMSLRVDIAVGGVVTDFGRLSAKSILTDSTGHASVIYTAPPPAGVAAPAPDVQIVVTPSETDFGNSNSRIALIHLVPPGVVVPPNASVTAAFTVNPASPTDHQSVLFDGTPSKSTTGTIVKWQWSFDDGGTATGQTVSHTFNSSGNFIVKLTVTDSIGASNSTSQTIAVGLAPNPTASFLTSPDSPVVNQSVTFNASASTATTGRFITSYNWDFGDGTTGSGVTTSHAYPNAATYTVVLQVVDDAGHVGTTSNKITVDLGFPHAVITVSPPSASVGQVVSFIGSQSTVSAGRFIVSYSWDFGDGTTGSGPTTSHAYSKAGTFTVTLVVTDDQNKSGIATAKVTITP
jgi:PKD repeat protein